MKTDTVSYFLQLTFILWCSSFTENNYKIMCKLILALWVKFSADDISKYFSYFSSMETICIKCQILFSGKNKKRYHQFVICWISPESIKGYLKIPWLWYMNTEIPKWFSNYETNCTVTGYMFKKKNTLCQRHTSRKHLYIASLV